MAVIYRALFVLFVISVSACSEESSECPLTIDTVAVVTSQPDDTGKEYFLVRRITGWHDKAVVFQVFDKKPEFDRCNRDLVKPVFEDSVEADKNVSLVVFDTSTNTFDVKYIESSGNEIRFDVR